MSHFRLAFKVSFLLVKPKKNELKEKLEEKTKQLQVKTSAHQGGIFDHIKVKHGKISLFRSDSWNKAHCIPLRFVDHHRRRNSWTVTRKASQDSNMSSSRNGKIIIRPKKIMFSLPGTTARGATRRSQRTPGGCRGPSSRATSTTRSPALAPDTVTSSLR